MISVQVTLRPSAADAAKAMAPQGAAARDTEPVAGLGDRASLSQSASGNARFADVTVQAGNAVIDVSCSVPASSQDTAALRSAAMAIASTALASLPTAPAADTSADASGFPASARPGRPYASPASACALPGPALLASSLPGAAVDPAEAARLTAGTSGSATCRWTAASGTLRIDVAVLGPAPSSPCPSPASETITACPGSGSFSFYGPGGTVQAISGLGDQATAYFAASSGPPLIVVTADSGNAIITVQMTWTGHPARATQLAQARAITRGVLGALPRSGRGGVG
jgi:hypothetical protein